MAAGRAPLYRRFLTPVLHRRFTSAALTVLAICYVEAVLIGEKSSLLWFWFPIGKVGIRTVLLFITALSVFILRVAQVHLGARTSASPFTIFTKFSLHLQTAQTLIWYLFSAWWFSEVYVWSTPGSADLGWMSEGKAWERKRLNERPIYIRSVFLMLAVLQAAYHVFYDYDQISLPISRTITERASKKSTNLLMFIQDQLKPLLPKLSQHGNQTIPSWSIGLRCFCISMFGPIVYALLLRKSAWNCSLWVAELLWDVPAMRLSYVPPYHVSLIYRSLTSGVLLVFLWESSNVLFGAFAAQEPLKKDQPLTSESNDPNGSLLNGLKSKKEIIRTFAFRELSHITQTFPTRRKAIFTDIDRVSGPMWNQTMILCLSNIIKIPNRITAFQNPPFSTPAPQQPTTIETLPRLSAPLRQDSILSNPPTPATTREKIESNIGSLAKSYGTSPNNPRSLPNPFSSPQAKRLINSTEQKFLTQDQQEQFSPSGIYAQFNEYILQFLRCPLGTPFRQTFQRRVSAVVLGTPFSEIHPLIDSISALSDLTVASLAEDPYGKVAKDVPMLIRTYITVVQAIESFVATMPVHWTDVEFTMQDRRIEEVEFVVGALKKGLGEMVGAFGSYAKDLGLEEGEIRVAKKIAGVDEES